MTLAVGLVGCGLVAERQHFPGFAALSDASVVAVASGRVENARAAASKFGVSRVHDRWEDLVADAEVDAVDICTTNALHAPVAIAAARAGKHVLVEKPMATTVKDCDAMIAAARDAAVVLMVHHNMRFTPVFEEMRRLLDAETIGPLYTIRAAFGHMGPDTSWGATSGWFWRSEDAGGGALMDLGVHIVDLVRWFAGSPAVDVTAMTSRVAKPTDAEDNALLLVRFDNGVIASIQSGWTSRPSGEMEIVIQGELGHIAFGRAFKRPLSVRLSGDERVEPKISETTESLYAHFVRCVREGITPKASGEDGREGVAIVRAAYESARGGRTVRLS